jgi:hypothetical protein
MSRQPARTIGFLLVLCGLAACAAVGGSKRETLTIADVNPHLRAIEGTPLDAVKSQNITYPVTGDARYDKFFKDAAITYGGFAVAHTMSEDVHKNLKAYARDWMYNKEAGKEVQKLGKDPDSLTDEQIGKILADKKKVLGELAKQERDYVAAAAHNMATASVSLKGSTEAVVKLLPQAQQLMSDVNTAFKAWKSPGVTNDLQATVTQLTKVKDDAIPLAKNVTTLTLVLSGLATTTTDQPATARNEPK